MIAGPPQSRLVPLNIKPQFPFSVTRFPKNQFTKSLLNSHEHHAYAKPIWHSLIVQSHKAPKTQFISPQVSNSEPTRLNLKTRQSNVDSVILSPESVFITWLKLCNKKICSKFTIGGEFCLLSKYRS